MGLFSTTLARSGALKGATDWHSHILPGVDDGVKTLSKSLAILADYERLGLAHLWLTPHIMEDVPNHPDDLRERFAELKEAYHGPIELHLAAENMLDSLFEERLESRDLLPIGEDATHLLVETSYYTPPYDLNGILQRVKGAGFYPLLAHPERYLYMELDQYHELHEMGIKMQMNLTSLAGLYGSEPRKRALWLLKQGYYNAFGSDLHRHHVLERFTTAAIPRSATKKLHALSL